MILLLWQGLVSGVGSWLCVGDVPLRGLLFFCASKAAAAGPLTRVMQVMVVILGRVGPLDSLFPFGPEGLEGLVWGVSMVAWWGSYFCLVVLCGFLGEEGLLLRPVW